MPASSSPTYPAIAFLVRYGGGLPVVAGFAVLAAVAALVSGGAWWAWPLGVIGALFAFLLVRSYVELVRVIADTLLPK